MFIFLPDDGGRTGARNAVLYRTRVQHLHEHSGLGFLLSTQSTSQPSLPCGVNTGRLSQRSGQTASIHKSDEKDQPLTVPFATRQ
jgi:hypothetical protein